MSFNANQHYFYMSGLINFNPFPNTLNDHGIYTSHASPEIKPLNGWAHDCACHSFSRREHLPDNWLKEMSCRLEFDAYQRPNYFIANPKALVTTSQPLSFTLGTGPQVLSSVLPLCLETKQELIIVTCFWSKKSQSCKDVASMLRKLSAKALQQDRTIQVRICFSTESSWRRFNPARRRGKIHPPKSWKRLGLPLEGEIKGLNLVVKSAFVPPFSVMHPKFILMDRHKTWMPSCNVSWETWLEGCIEMQGEVTERIYDFWNASWGSGSAELPPLDLESEAHGSVSAGIEIIPSESEESRSHMAAQTPVSLTGIPTILLPSPHNWNPSFLLGWPHITPLTTFFQHIFRAAKSKIYIQTPNLTCRLALKALVEAFKRGVNIHIITSKRLMMLEQLVTAGSVTEHEVRHLGRHYKKLRHERKAEIERSERQAHRRGGWVGVSPPKLGSLDVGYYRPKTYKDENEPTKSHLKFVCVDDEVTVLGSGNMDRASWYTSQELGIAFFSKDLAEQLSQSVEDALKDRVKYAYKLSI